MSSSTGSPWTWDPNRKDHYRWSAADDCYIYNNGLRLARDGTVLSQNPAQPSASRYDTHTLDVLGQVLLNQLPISSSQLPRHVEYTSLETLQSVRPESSASGDSNYNVVPAAQSTGLEQSLASVSLKQGQYPFLW
jgi:hypothetical protein